MLKSVRLLYFWNERAILFMVQMATESGRLWQSKELSEELQRPALNPDNTFLC